jgi:hypothetical protein
VLASGGHQIGMYVVCDLVVEFEERNLVALLKNNPNLRTVIISECSLSKSLFDAITKYCPQLKHLSISLEDKFTGQSLSNLPNL